MLRSRPTALSWQLETMGVRTLTSTFTTSPTGFFLSDVLPNDHNGTRGVVYSRDGELLVTVGGKGDTKVWRTSDMQLLSTFNHGSHPLPVGRAFARWNTDCDGARRRPRSICGVSTERWLASSTPQFPPLHKTFSPNSSVAFSPDGTLLAAFSKDGVNLGMSQVSPLSAS